VASIPVADTIIATSPTSDDHPSQRGAAALLKIASSFLLKDVRRDQLVDAIRTVAPGDAQLHPALTKWLLDNFCSGPAPRERPAGVLALTEREPDVPRLVARGRGNTEIAKDLFLSEATVKTHLAHVTAKPQLSDGVQAVVFAYESGLIRAGGGR
jgi:DNA-binding NarL/FixJ family response regulator